MSDVAHRNDGEAPTGRVLVVDDQLRVRQSIADILACLGHRTETCAGAIEALEVIARRDFDVIITDLKMPSMNGLEFIEQLQQRGVDAQIVMITAHATIATAVEAMRRGAFDYIEKPFNADQLERLVARALHRSCDLRDRLPRDMIGDSEPMRLLQRRIAVVAPTSETVLITGESGTGKELVARSIHAGSGRAERQLVGLNCPALSRELMESELFGHERGAFTSADAPRVGRFELADGGTILLDEVTEIDMPVQAKLLRVLQEQAFERVGSSSTIDVDVRVLATTNRDLHAEVTAGRFREDLYFRLAVVPLHVPPLRDRVDDVPALVEHFLTHSAQRLQRDPPRLATDALDMLCQYHWPGNVRELENLITRATVLAGCDTIDAAQLRPWLIDADGHHAAEAGATIKAGLSLQDMERQLIEATLDHFGGHRAHAAQALGIGVRTLSNKLRSYGYAPRTKAFAKAA